jgi:hypothetical protein
MPGPSNEHSLQELLGGTVLGDFAVDDNSCLPKADFWHFNTSRRDGGEEAAVTSTKQLPGTVDCSGPSCATQAGKDSAQTFRLKPCQVPTNEIPDISLAVVQANLNKAFPIPSAGFA